MLLVDYQNNQVYSGQTMVSSQHVPHDQSRMTSTNPFPQNQNQNQTQINTGNGSSVGNYNHQGMSQSAFGGFNFGMNNNVNGLNLASNIQNLNFSRKEPITSQLNKGPHFDQQQSNKCWSVGKLPTR